MNVMNMNYRNRHKEFLVSGITWCFLLIMMLVVINCGRVTKQQHFIRLDLSKEHDAGRFMPDKGDQVFIKGNFKNEEKFELLLEDYNGDWIYTVPLGDVLQKTAEPVDSLNFSFLVVTGDDRYLPNGGKEAITWRIIRLKDLYNKKPVFIFNEVFDDRPEAEVTFTVGVANQKVLGFFKPEERDILVVTGDFCKWDERGIPMNSDKNDDIFSVTIPVKYDPDQAIQYKYRILTNRKVILPNNGWEGVPNRALAISKNVVSAPYVEFSDLRRVARFIINTKSLEKDGKFNPLKGDILQINLSLDGQENLSDALVFVEEYQYETAVIIPLTVKDIKWQLIKNIKEVLTEWQSVEVGLKGKLIPG